jgi:hypothetical protein
MTNDLETAFVSQLIQGAYPLSLESFRIEEADASLRAAGQEMEVIQSVIMFLP